MRDHPPAVKRYLPILLLDPRDGYGPSDPLSFLESSRLVWNGRDFSVDADPAALLRREVEIGGNRYRGSELTRPYGDPALRPVGLFERPEEGFCLTCEPREPGYVDLETDRVEPTFPVFYEYVRRRFVTYWFFYDWSTVPLRTAPSYTLSMEEEAQLATETIELEDSLPADLRIAYPGLTTSFRDEFAQALGEPADLDAGGGAVVVERVSFSVGDFIRRLREAFEEIGQRFGGLALLPVAHEGDWERISIRLDDDDQMTQVAYYQHSGPPEIVASAGLDEPPEVRVARGSHASYPPRSAHRKVRLIEHAELFGGFRLELSPAQLSDVRAQPWYGYGGAWGRFLGPNTNQVGPIGPSPYKSPTPFGMSG